MRLARFAFLLSVFSPTLFVMPGCETNLSPTNSYDPDAPADLQKKATLTGTISGAATNGPSSLLEGATVQLKGAVDPNPALVTTETDGAYTFTDIVPGSYILETAHPLHVSQMQPVLFQAGDSQRVEVVLSRISGVDDQGGRLTGQAVLAAQMSLPEGEQDHSGILVEVEGAGIRTYTNQEGTFDLFLAGGNYNLLFSALDHLPTRRDDVAVAAGLENQLPESPVVLSANPGSISGVVLLEGKDGGNLQDSTVSLSAGNAITTDDGGFVISDVAPGTYDLTISHGGFDTQTINGIRVHGGKQTVVATVSLAISRGSVSGNVTKIGAGNHAGIVVELAGTAHTSVTNSLGDFVLDRVPVGIYELVARHDGYLKDSVSSITVVANQDTPLSPLDLSVWQVSFSINDDDAFAVDDQVTLSLTAPDAAVMRISEDPGFFDAAYISFAGSHNEFLSAGDGLKTLYVQFETLDGIASDVISDSIALDTAGPAGTAIVIESGAKYATDLQAKVTLSLSATDLTSGVTGMRISNDGVFDNEPVLPYSEVVTDHFLTNPGVGGAKTVYAVFIDQAGNVSEVTAQDDIVLDNQAPAVNQFELNNGLENELTNNNVVQVQLDISDDVSGQVSVALVEGVINCATATYSYPPQGPVAYTLVSGDGIRGLNLCAIDAAGNYTSLTAATNSIELDTLGPAIPDLTRTSISDIEIGLSWSTTGDAQSYVLQRRRSDQGGFTDIAYPAAGESTYTDTIDATSLGKRHFYRIQAYDPVSNPSGFSIELDAGVPICAPQLVYVNGEQQRSLFWDMPDGTSISLATYAWEYADGTLVEEPLALNATQYLLDPLTTDVFNERLVLRTNNSDNSLAWETEYRFGNLRQRVARTTDEASNGGLLVDQNGIVHVCYLDNINGQLLYMVMDQDCFSDFDHCPVLLDDDGSPGSGCTMSQGPDGVVHVAYQEGANRDLRYMRLDDACMNDLPSCPVTVDTEDIRGHWISLDVDSGNIAHIAYYEQGIDQLKYAVIDDACLADLPNCPMVLDGPRVGEHPSIAIDSQDVPHVAYHDDNSGDLAYMKLDDSCFADLASCPQILDGTLGIVGTYVNMGIDKNDTPHIIYWAGSSSTPRYMILNNDCWADLANCPIDLTPAPDNNMVYNLTAGFDAAGIAHVVYEDVDTDSIRYMRLDEGCLTDIASCPVDIVSGFTYIRPHATTADRFGNAYFLYNNSMAYELTLHKIENNPYSRPIMNIGMDGGVWYPNVAMGDEDVPHLAYIHYTTGTSFLYHDLLDGISDPVGVYTGRPQGLKMAIDSSNTPHLVFADATASPGEIYYMKLDAACLEDLVSCPVFLDAAGYSDPYMDLVIDSTDTPHLTYYDSTSQVLRYAYLDDTCFSDVASCPVDLYSAGDHGLEMGIDVDSTDTPHIAYMDEYYETVHHMKLDAACLDDIANCAQLIDDTSVGYVVDLAIDSNDVVHIAGYDMGTGYFIIYSLGETTTVSPVDGPFGEYGDVAMAIGQDDIIHLTYYTTSNEQLGYTRMDGFSPSLIVDSDNRAGAANSVAIDSHGTPHLYYYRAFFTDRESRYIRGPFVRSLPVYSKVQQ